MNDGELPVCIPSFVSLLSKYLVLFTLSLSLSSYFLYLSITGKRSWENGKLSKLNIFNAGIGGDKTQNVLWRLNGLLAHLQQPLLFVLNIGTNNIEKDHPEGICSYFPLSCINFVSCLSYHYRYCECNRHFMYENTRSVSNISHSPPWSSSSK